LIDTAFDCVSCVCEDGQTGCFSLIRLDDGLMMYDELFCSLRSIMNDEILAIVGKSNINVLGRSILKAAAIAFRDSTAPNESTPDDIMPAFASKVSPAIL